MPPTACARRCDERRAGGLWPYFALLLVGFLPNEIWRVLGLVLARGLDEDSEIVVWSRAVATAILAGVIAKLILFSPGASRTFRWPCASAPRSAASWHFWRSSVRSLPALLVGEVALLLGGFFFAR